MEMRLRLPVGIDSFEKLRKGNYYYCLLYTSDAADEL